MICQNLGDDDVARLLSTLGLLVLALGSALPADAAPKKDIDAIRAECFRQANEAASKLRRLFRLPRLRAQERDSTVTAVQSLHG